MEVKKIKRVCVFLGSNFGAKESYRIETRKLGLVLAKNGITLVYGGTNRGLMGELASSVMENGGQVIGVIPECLIEKNHAHENLTEIIPTHSMTDRKTMLKNLADGFIVLPGGVGTLDELFEVLTENKIDLHQKPIGILNIDNFYNPMFEFMGKMVESGFFSQDHQDNLLVASDSESLLAKLTQGRNKQVSENHQETEISLRLSNIQEQAKQFSHAALQKTLSFKTRLLLNLFAVISLVIPDDLFSTVMGFM